MPAVIDSSQIKILFGFHPERPHKHETERLGFFAAGREPTAPQCSVKAPLLGFYVCCDKEFLKVTDICSGAHVKQREFGGFLSSYKLGFVLENLC